MRSLLRFVALVLASALLVVLANCSPAPNTNPSADPSLPTQSSPTDSTSTHSISGEQKININTAILSELDQFEAKLGIPALSHRIQSSRPYGSPEELVSKKVLTQSQFDQIKEQVTVEDIVLTGEAKDVDYMTKLGLMKGHLIVGKELLDLGQPAKAEPHIGHPVEEIYVDVEEQLNERNVPEFKTGLIQLQDLVKSKPKDPKLATVFEQSVKAIDQAIAVLPESQRQSPEFILKVMDGLLDAANAEYGAAIANDKITAEIEYQDSRGFVEYADTLQQSIAKPLTEKNAEAQKTIAESVTKLKTAWPSPVAPKTPVLTVEEVTQLIKTIEQTSQKVLK